MTDLSAGRPQARCDLCGDPLPASLAPYHRDNRKPGECLCFVSSDGQPWDD